MIECGKVDRPNEGLGGPCGTFIIFSTHILILYYEFINSPKKRQNHHQNDVGRVTEEEEEFTYLV